MDGKETAVGVLDIDCQTAGVWSHEDREGLIMITQWLMASDGVVDWGTVNIHAGREKDGQHSITDTIH